jgi:hypothetical protein
MTRPIFDYDGQCADCAVLRSERDQYARAMDGLAAQVANASDKRAAVQLKALIREVHAMLRHVTGKVALGHDERPYVDAVKARLVENGASVYEEQS